MSPTITTTYMVSRRPPDVLECKRRASKEGVDDEQRRQACRRRVRHHDSPVVAGRDAHSAGARTERAPQLAAPVRHHQFRDECACDEHCKQPRTTTRSHAQPRSNDTRAPRSKEGGAQPRYQQSGLCAGVVQHTTRAPYRERTPSRLSQSCSRRWWCCCAPPAIPAPPMCDSRKRTTTARARQRRRRRQR
jgi:hypothetical protein